MICKVYNFCYLSHLLFCELPRSVVWFLSLILENSWPLIFQLIILLYFLFFIWYSNYVHFLVFEIVLWYLDVLTGFCLFHYFFSLYFSVFVNVCQFCLSFQKTAFGFIFSVIVVSNSFIPALTFVIFFLLLTLHLLSFLKQ